MKLISNTLMLLALSGLTVFAADANHASIAQIEDQALSQAEHEIVSLAEAMPADKYDFAPTNGDFNGVRTFGLQISHIAAVIDEFASAILGEKGIDLGKNENGPESLHGKDAIVKFLKDAFAHGHKAMNAITDQDFTEMVDLPWGKMPKGALAGMSASHSFDHYGQAVVYARMNGVVPPASQK
ncbi:MAG: DinB family protein [Acidobacteriota bacterium]|nr:DinB family protein [Acidobacteriota bacterium]